MTGEPETDRRPKRPRWRKKRWWAAGLLWLAAYPLSFVPSCWVLTRTDPERSPLAWAVVREAHRPAAAVLKASPPPVQDGVRRAVEWASSDGAGFQITPGWIGVARQVPDDDPYDFTIQIRTRLVW